VHKAVSLWIRLGKSTRKFSLLLLAVHERSGFCTSFLAASIPNSSQSFAGTHRVQLRLSNLFGKISIIDLMLFSPITGNLRGTTRMIWKESSFLTIGRRFELFCNDVGRLGTRKANRPPAIIRMDHEEWNTVNTIL